MCLAVPGKVLEITEGGPMRMAQVDFGGVVKEVCLAYLPEVEVGEYVIVHVGFAIQKLDEASALATLDLFESTGMLEEEFGDAWAQDAADPDQPGADQPGIRQPGADAAGTVQHPAGETS